jgi:ferric citrate transport system substrate-binding protein
MHLFIRSIAAALAVAGSGHAQSSLTIRHELGSVEIKSTPRRIVVLEYSFLDALTALGVKPVAGAIAASGGDRGVPPYLAAASQGIALVGSRGQPSLELILAQKPDLILADLTRHKAIAPQLAAIAPTVVWKSQDGSYEDILAQFADIGKIVGKSELAKQLLGDQERLLAKTKALVPKNTPQTLPAVAWAQGFTVQSNESFTGSLLAKLGRKVEPPQNGVVRFEVTLEALSAKNPNQMVIFKANDEKLLLDEWRKNALWDNLSAVKNGRIYVFDRDLWTRGKGVLALKLMFRQAIDSGFVQNKPPASGYQLR